MIKARAASRKRRERARQERGSGARGGGQVGGLLAGWLAGWLADTDRRPVGERQRDIATGLRPIKPAESSHERRRVGKCNSQLLDSLGRPKSEESKADTHSQGHLA